MVETTLKQQILDLIPQKEPFRFVDSILDVKENSISENIDFARIIFFIRVISREIQLHRELS